jgi:ATP/ADP translocase
VDIGYSMVRSVFGVFFLQIFGAKDTPWSSLAVVVVLTVVVGLINRFQKSLNSQQMFAVLSAFSAVLFLGGYFFFELGWTWLAAAHLIWKEVYIVLFIHLLWGYAVLYFPEKGAKLVFSWIAGLGSIGGMLGGFWVKNLTQAYGLYGVYSFLVFTMLVSVVLFFNTRVVENKSAVVEKSKSPLKEVQSEWRYVGLIAVLVALTQWVITILDFRMNVEVSRMAPTLNDKAAMLGTIFAYLNIITLSFKFVLLPVMNWLLTRVQSQMAVPLMNIGILMILSMYNPFIAAVGGFLFIKAMDYSVFSITKEYLYYPLTQKQVFGAKYFVDMWVYRAAKAFTAGFLLLETRESVLQWAVWAGLAAWALFAIRLKTISLRLALAKH